MNLTNGIAARILGSIKHRPGRRVVRTAWAILIAVILFGVVGHFGAPPLVHDVVAPKLAAALKRPVRIGAVDFNPYTLRLRLGELIIGDPGGSQRPFVNIYRLRVHVSWQSLFRLKPIIHEVTIDHPSIMIVRAPDRAFNFSDLIEQPKPPAPPSAAPSAPRRFSVSNIRVLDGEVRFDDELLGTHHVISNIEIGVPFITNLPAYEDIYVQPLVRMDIDGSRFKLDGKSQPFSATRESSLEFRLHRLELGRYLAYAPNPPPVTLPGGALSALLKIEFEMPDSGPVVKVNGAVSLDDVDLHDRSGARMLALKHSEITLIDAEPLTGTIHLGELFIDGLKPTVVIGPDGVLNYAVLTSHRTASSMAASPPAATTAVTSPVQSAIPAKAGSPGTPAPIAASSPIAPSPAPTDSPVAPASPTATASPAAIASPAASSAPKTISAPITAAAPAPIPPPVPASAPSARSGSKPAFDLTLDSASMIDSSVAVSDQRATPPASASLNAITFSLKGLRTTPGHPAPFEFSAKPSGGGSIALKGDVDLGGSAAKTQIALAQIGLAPYSPFIAAILPGGITSGTLAVQANVAARFGAAPVNVHVEPATIALTDFALGAKDKSESPVRLKALNVAIAQVDLASRNAVVKEISLDQLNAIVRRAKDGTINLQSLVSQGTAQPAAPQQAAVIPETRRKRDKTAARPHAKGRARVKVAVVARPRAKSPGAATAALPAASAPWRYQIATIDVRKAAIQFNDESVKQPLKMSIDPLDLKLSGISNDLAHPVNFDFSAKFSKRGEVKLAGKATPEPLSVNARINVRRLDLAAFSPYIGDRLNAKIPRASFSAAGAFRLAKVRDATRIGYQGDAGLYDVRMLDKVNNKLFARWGAFTLRRIDFRSGDGPMLAKVGTVALDNFYVQIILNADGKLNVRDLVASPTSQPKSLTTPEGPGSEAAAAPAASVGSAQSAQPVIEIDETRFSGGKVNYSDYFIKPNYSADLSDMAGGIGPFGTRLTTPAPVQLAGKVNDSAPIDIHGSASPLAPMAYLDITAKATGIELTGLSAYSTKYTGYPIEKGTLSLDVHYLLDQQKLTADNKIVLDQLTFGDHVETPGALNLPIRLAVALLKDSQGRINLSVPISGSLADPKFSIGAVVWNVVSNLIIKAAEAPFKLLASVVGSVGNIAGGKQANLSQVDFKPGRSTLTPADIDTLSTLAKALQERPALQLEIKGQADPAVDRDGLKQAMVDRQVALRKLRAEGGSGQRASLDQMQLSTDDYDKYLKKAYKAAKFKKPTDLIGLDKSLPPAEMNKLMIEHTEVTDDDLRKLADTRAQTVRAWLSQKVSPNRLFIVAPNLNAAAAAKGELSAGVKLALR